MKKNLLLLFSIVLLSFTLLNAQNPDFPKKHDAIWLGGQGSWAGQALFGEHKIDFNHFPATVEQVYLDIEFNSVIGIICNEEGELQCYTNGDYMATYTGEVMENGLDINPDTSVDQTLGYQEILTIPYPEEEGKYYFIHKEEKWILDDEGNTMDGFWTQNIKTYYTLVDMNLNGGLGKVVEKNVEILNDTLNFGLLTATKHANGRDWWMILPEYWSNDYYRYLITSDGIDTLEQQIIDVEEGLLPSLGQAVFTPDGSKYIVTGSSSYMPDSVQLDIYDFNRCTGLLSNHRRKYYENTSFGKPAAVSSNSRYLYLYISFVYYQYDLWAEDIIASEVVLGEYDGFESPLNTYPYLAQIGLDGKIYLSTRASTDVLHVIHDPDFGGEEARLEQHGIQLPKLNYGTIPNHPNYRLGPLDGSPCDTLGINNYPVANFRHEIFNDTVFFRDLSAYAPTDWYWTFGDGEDSTEKHNNHTYGSGGDYEVCLTVSNENGSDTWCDSLTIISTANVEVEMPEVATRIYPNPVSDILYFQAEQNLPSRSVFVLRDMNGRVVFEEDLTGGQKMYALDLPVLANGFYFYEIMLKGVGISEGKVVVLR